MVGHRADAANAAVGEHGGEALAHAALGHAERLGQRGVGAWNQRQAALGGEHEAAVELREGSFIHAGTRGILRIRPREGSVPGHALHHQASSLISTKYSRSLGNRCTTKPVAASMRRAQSAMPSGVSVASTNHMLSACSRR